MSKHKMVNGQLLQMDKSYSQLKTRQKEKITAWMYEAYKKQVEEDLTNEEALDIVYSRIEDAGIWIPDYEIEKRYNSRKNQFKKRLAKENIPKHIFEMEAILDKVIQKMDALEARIADYQELQSEIRKLEEYYTSQQWKDDFALDEAGEFPKNLKRGVLSEDGIYNVLERNKELMERIQEK